MRLDVRQALTELVPQQLPTPQILPVLWGMPKNRGPFVEGSIPIDVSQLSLFETMYVHPLARDSMIIWEHYNLVALKSIWVVTGSPWGADQFIGGILDSRLHVSKGKWGISDSFTASKD
jgi:dimethylaniline monooxygenase (N-oxide forming)